MKNAAMRFPKRDNLLADSIKQWTRC